MIIAIRQYITGLYETITTNPAYVASTAEIRHAVLNFPEINENFLYLTHQIDKKLKKFRQALLHLSNCGEDLCGTISEALLLINIEKEKQSSAKKDREKYYKKS